MANTHIIALVALIVLPLAFFSVSADYDEKVPFHGLPKKSVVVEGMVYCQNCKKLGTSSLSEANPIPFAKVKVTCINYRKHVFYYKEHTANENGYVYARLEGFTMDHQLLDHPLTSCIVKLVSSPIEGCNIPTNINNGIIGASLRYEHKRLITKDRDTVFFSAGPLSFHHDQCNADGTHY